MPGILDKLAEYFRSIFSDPVKWRDAAPVDLVAVFGPYAASLLRFEAEVILQERVNTARRPGLSAEESVKLAFSKIRCRFGPRRVSYRGLTGTRRTDRRPFIGFTETLGEYERRGGIGMAPGRLSAFPPDGEWERLIQEAWDLVRSSARVAMPRHPFQFALRRPFAGKEFSRRISPFLEARSRDLANDLSILAQTAEAESAQAEAAPTRMEPVTLVTGEDPVKAERTALVLAYKDEGRQKRKKITDKMIAEAACRTWHDRTPIQRWKRNDKRSTSADDARIRKVLRDKPHLK
jgi:hypothetical protein